MVSRETTRPAQQGFLGDSRSACVEGLSPNRRTFQSPGELRTSQNAFRPPYENRLAG